MIPDLSRRAASLREQMDDPGCDLPTLERTYARFGTVNALVSGWRRVYRRELRPRLSPNRPGTLLDIGCGGGDVPRRLAEWAGRDGLRLTVTGIDADERAIAYATALPPRPDLEFRRALSGDLVHEGRTFDFVTSNHLLHHLTGEELGGLLRDSEALCRVRVVHRDLARQRVAYRVFRVWARLFRGSFIREDGLLSIRRSFADEAGQAQVRLVSAKLLEVFEELSRTQRPRAFFAIWSATSFSPTNAFRRSFSRASSLCWSP